MDEHSTPENPQKFENRTSASSILDTTTVTARNTQKSENRTSASMKTEPVEVRNENSQIFNNRTPRSSKNELLQVHDLNSNNTDTNKTDLNDTDFIISSSRNNTSDFPKKMEKTTNNASDMLFVSSSFLDSEGAAEHSAALNESSKDRSEQVTPNDRYLQSIREIKHQISYDILIADHPAEKNLINELVALMAETLTFAEGNISINNQKIPAELVKSRLRQHNMLTFQYVLEALRNSETKLYQPRAYNLTVLYNAPVTIGSYYDAAYRHDRATAH